MTWVSYLKDYSVDSFDVGITIDFPGFALSYFNIFWQLGFFYIIFNVIIFLANYLFIKLKLGKTFSSTNADFDNVCELLTCRTASPFHGLRSHAKMDEWKKWNPAHRQKLFRFSSTAARVDY